VIRAFMGNLTDPGRPQGGSTITQQVVKNLLVGDDVTYERKMREMIVAARAEQVLSKPEILELYLNAIYLGRNAWGLEAAAQTYFGKPARALTAQEGALLAGLAKGPNFYNPDRHPERARERLAYVLTRMREDGVITEAQVKQGLESLPKLAAYERPRRTSGFHFVDHLNRDAKAVAGIAGLTASSYTVRSTLHPALQEATEAALQEGLARYELSTGRQRFEGAEANLARAIEALEKQAPKPAERPRSGPPPRPRKRRPHRPRSRRQQPLRRERRQRPKNPQHLRSARRHRLRDPWRLRNGRPQPRNPPGSGRSNPPISPSTTSTGRPPWWCRPDATSRAPTSCGSA
jgi:membrane carboxypeptidase/penicillin-binding protein